MTPLEAGLHGIDSYVAANPSFPGAETLGARCRGILRAYAKRWYKDDQRYSVVGVEEFLTAPIINPSTEKQSPYQAAGKIDVRLKQSDRHGILDHKLLSCELSDGQVQHLEIDTQPMQYALLEHLNGNRVEFAVWDVVVKTQHRPSKKGESLSDFEKRIEEVYSESPSKYFARHEIQVMPYNLVEYAGELYAWTKMIESATRTGMSMKNSNSCFDFNRPCKYLPICSKRSDMLDNSTWTKASNLHPELDLPAGLDPKMLITNSRMKTFRACYAKHDYQYNIGLKKRYEDEAEPLWIGSCWHKGMEEYWKVLAGLSPEIVQSNKEIIQ